jgi:multiple sugar transport system ATP-binding protein
MTLADRVVVMNHGVIKQLGTPTEIYDRPANTFVASFIGSPAMNLIEGDIVDGVFRAEGVAVPVQGKGPVTLGFRAEDVQVSAGPAQLAAHVYSMELLGDATLVSVRIGEALVSIRASKDFRVDIGALLHVAIPADKIHIFDRKTGARR